MRRQFFYALALCAVPFPLTARAAAILDQSFDPTGQTKIYSDVNLEVADYAQEAQGFQVGVSGRLIQANLLLTTENPGGGGNLELQVRRATAAGTPSDAADSVLAVADVPVTALSRHDPGFIAFNFGANAPLVQAGDRLTLTLIETAPQSINVDWVGAAGNLYGSGSSSVKSHLFYHDVWSVPEGFNGGLDLGFSTYVDPAGTPTPVPEPSALLLAGVMAGGAVWFRRRADRA